MGLGIYSNANKQLEESQSARGVFYTGRIPEEKR